jgi:hypothetical protein
MSFFKYSIMVLSSAAAVAMCTPAQAQEEAAPDASATPKMITWSGSVRWRLQHEAQRGGYSAAAGRVGDTRDDWFQRLQARIGAQGKVNDDVMIGIRLSTSASPAGTNQNLGNTADSSFNGRKPIFFDLAYFDYRIMDGLNVQAGKAPNMYWSAGKGALMYASGESIDGLNLIYQGKGDAIKPFAFASYNVIANRDDNTPGGTVTNKEGPDINVLGVQAGATWTANPMWATAAVGYYMWNNMAGAPLDVNFDSTTKSLGNTYYTAGGTKYFAYEFNPIDVGLEFGYEMGFAPVTISTEYITNSGSKASAPAAAVFSKSDEAKTAWQANLKVGDAKKTGWWFGGGYRDVGADAVVAEMRKAGVPGGGGTDMLGWNLTVGKVFGKGFSGNIDYENATRNLSNNETSSVRGFGYENWNFDVQAEF